MPLKPTGITKINGAFTTAHATNPVVISGINPIYLDANCSFYAAILNLANAGRGRPLRPNETYSHNLINSSDSVHALLNTPFRQANEELTRGT